MKVNPKLLGWKSATNPSNLDKERTYLLKRKHSKGYPNGILSIHYNPNNHEAYIGEGFCGDISELNEKFGFNIIPEDKSITQHEGWDILYRGKIKNKEELKTVLKLILK